MNALAFALLSNQFWYGFFIGFMMVIGVALVSVFLIRARLIARR